MILIWSFEHDAWWKPGRCGYTTNVIVQFHPRQSDYVNIHPNVLHLWHWTAGAFPTPPIEAV